MSAWSDGGPIGFRRLAVCAVMLSISVTLAACAPPTDGVETGETPYASNGQRIYHTRTNERGERIAFEGGFDVELACADCHGSDGRGAEPEVAGVTLVAPDIRYSVLAGEHTHDEGAADDHEEEEAHVHDHPPYTDESLKRAITEGVNPEGRMLVPLMPRWRMSDEDMADLVEYLKTLE